jgi:predicted nucleic acid binding AN1-type Zn finger protein
MMLNMMKSRCAQSECKVRIPSFTPECKCKSKFCGAHRGHVDHGCTFDYKEEHATNLLKTMSTAVIGEKMERI